MGQPEPPEGYIDTRVIAMTDAEGNDVDDPARAARIEVEQVTEDGVVENVIFSTDNP